MKQIQAPTLSDIRFVERLAERSEKAGRTILAGVYRSIAREWDEERKTFLRQSAA